MMTKSCLVSQALCVFISLVAVKGDDPCIPLPSPGGPTEQDLPFCGNGVIDPGEVCDDGNRAGGDGCNAWCSAFDRMTRACTLAGQNYYYAAQASSPKCLSMMLSASTFSASEAYFCDLNAVAASPDGSFILVADGGLLVRVELFTDSVMNSLSIFPATITYPFKRFCSLFIMEDGDTVVAHECQEQSVVIFTAGGTQFSKPASLPFHAPSMKSRALLQDGQILYAGLDPDVCVKLFAFNISSMYGTVLANVGCTGYNVIENGIVYPSFSLDGMVPYQVCPLLS